MRPHYTLNIEPSVAPVRWNVFRWIAAVTIAASIPFLQSRPSDASSPGNQAPVERPVYSRGSGTVDQVLVAYGERVTAGQVIARMDSTELDHDIDGLVYRIALVTDELESGLLMAARGHYAKAAERGQVQIQKRSLENDLKYLRVKKALLEIKAPVSGRLITREPAKAVGQRTEPGDVLFHVEPAQS